MGRPPKSDFSRRSKGIRIRLTPAEYAWIKVIAQENGETMREVLWDGFQKKTQNYDDLRDYFCKKIGCPDNNHILVRQRQEAWNHLRKLAICSVAGDDKLIKHLTFEEWDRSRDFLKLLIDFYAENAPNA